MQLIPLPQKPQTPKIDLIVDDMIASINVEMQRRIDNHSKIYHKFWDSELTPDEILNALNERGLANHVLTFASTNITHFAEFAEKAGKTLDDIIDESEWKPRRAFTVNGNEVGLEPPADGYDAWGNLIPVVEEIEDIIDPEVLIEEPDIE